MQEEGLAPPEAIPPECWGRKERPSYSPAEMQAPGPSPGFPRTVRPAGGAFLLCELMRGPLTCSVVKLTEHIRGLSGMEFVGKALGMSTHKLNLSWKYAPSPPSSTIIFYLRMGFLPLPRPSTSPAAAEEQLL